MTIVVITGGSRGLGAATARACAHRGMGVVLTYNANPESAMRVVDDITADGGTAVALPLDVADTASFGEFRDLLQASLSTTWNRQDFDRLVNNAGYGAVQSDRDGNQSRVRRTVHRAPQGPLFPDPGATAAADRRRPDQRLQREQPRRDRRVAPYATFKGGLEVLTRYRPRSSAPEDPRQRDCAGRDPYGTRRRTER